MDEKNVNLLGFSQGTILSYAVALSYPEKVKNIIALSGYINENILVETYKENNFDHLNFYSSHGEKLNIKHVFEEFPAGHGVAPQNFYSFKKWISTKI